MLNEKAAATVDRIVAAARREGRDVLLEPEGLELLSALGIPVPPHVYVEEPDEAAIAAIDALPGDRLVLKLVSPDVLHKTDVGAVAIVPREELNAELDDFARRFPRPSRRGFLVMAFVSFASGFGRELLLGLRHTEDFGPVLSIGAGGTATELLATEIRDGREVAIISPDHADADDLVAAIAGCAGSAAATTEQRGQAPMIAPERLGEIAASMLALAAETMPHDIAELEINPLVLSHEGPVALDFLAKLGQGKRDLPAPRPLSRMKALLEPESFAVMGVSSRMNPGRIILKNVLAAGFDPADITVIKPGTDEIDGCRCLPDLAALEEPVDLLVVSVAAEQVAGVLREVVEKRRAESLIVIPGGMGETEGGKKIEADLREVIASSRSGDWGGPVINGGNCLGIRSRPGRYDTLFIPPYKFANPERAESPLAVISQSGAFAVARASRYENLNPRYLVTFGNQLDLTAADYLEYLADDRKVEVFACYVEGFQPDDGRRWLAAARKIRDRGGKVVFFRAGRSPSGAKAAASHTASVAGDWAVTRQLARAAGVLVAESLEDFDDLVGLCCGLRRKKRSGNRLAALSNAGFECVAMADTLGPMALAEISAETGAELGEFFAAARLDKIVDVHNPVDVTPIMNDELYAKTAEKLAEAPEVDLLALGCVPLTGAMQTLPAGEGHCEDLRAEGAVAPRLVALARECEKPIVAVVDSGRLYDPLARYLEDEGLPTFRSADRALRLLGLWLEA